MPAIRLKISNCDADGNRLSSTTGSSVVKYLVDPEQAFAEVLEERDGSGNLVARYDYGDDLVRGGLASGYLFDGLGSTRQLTSLAGAVTDTYLYDAALGRKAEPSITVWKSWYLVPGAAVPSPYLP